MRIIYLHQYYHTPEEGGGVRSYHVAHALADAGHDVHVITTWAGPVKRVVREGKLLVTWLPIRYENGMAKAERIAAFRAFVWASYQEAKAWLPADQVFATSTPLTIGLTALLLKLRHGVPYMFEVRDAWPEAPIQLGAVRSPVYKSVLRALERRIYAAAESLIALSPAMQRHVQERAPGKAVSLIPNFADRGFYGQAEHVGSADSLAEPGQRYGLFHIVYAGTFGYANQVMRLVELAKAARADGLPVRFTLAGEGAEREAVERFVQENGLAGMVRLLPHGSNYGVRMLLNEANAAYVGFRPEPVLEANSPNKFFDALAAGVPLLVGVKGWLADLVREEGCGIALADYANDLAGLKALMQADAGQMSRAASAAAARFDRPELVRQVVELLTQG